MWHILVPHRSETYCERRHRYVTVSQICDTYTLHEMIMTPTLGSARVMQLVMMLPMAMLRATVLAMRMVIAMTRAMAMSMAMATAMVMVMVLLLMPMSTLRHF